MKRLIATILAVVMIFAFTLSTAAAEFVPSITNKGEPELVVIDIVDGKEVVGFITGPNGEQLSTEFLECLIISSITEALTGEDLPDGVAEELINVYNELKNGKKISEVCPSLTEIIKEKWGEDKDVDTLVIKDLFDVTDYCDDITEHLKDGAILDLTFDVGVGAGTFITAMVYVDGEWVPVVDCVNNGDGTVTVKFDKICPVAFLVPGGGLNADTVSPITSDTSGIVLWMGIMFISLFAIVAIVIYRRKVNS